MPQVVGLEEVAHSDYIKLRATASGSGTININNESRTGTDVLIQKGTFVRFSNHAKLYLMTSDLQAKLHHFEMFFQN